MSRMPWVVLVCTCLSLLVPFLMVSRSLKGPNQNVPNSPECVILVQRNVTGQSHSEGFQVNFDSFRCHIIDGHYRITFEILETYNSSDPVGLYPSYIEMAARSEELTAMGDVRLTFN